MDCSFDNTIMQVKNPNAPMYEYPMHEYSMSSKNDSYVSEALMGEQFTVSKIVHRDDNTWCYGKLSTDGYEGYIDRNNLCDKNITVTHKVTNLRTYIYPNNSIKSTPLHLISTGSMLKVIGDNGDFFELDVWGKKGFVYKQHLSELSIYQNDFVQVAEAFLGTAYLWGGRTSLGIDCSALLQMSLACVGIASPRDASLQEVSEIFTILPFYRDRLHRGSIIFWRGHVAIMVDEDYVVHASGWHMYVVKEKINDAIERINGSIQGGMMPSCIAELRQDLISRLK